MIVPCLPLDFPDLVVICKLLLQWIWSLLIVFDLFSCQVYVTLTMEIVERILSVSSLTTVMLDVHVKLEWLRRMNNVSVSLSSINLSDG